MLTLLTSTSVFASDLTTKFSGGINVRGGMTSQDIDMSAHKKKFALDSNANFKVLVNNKVNDNFCYGGVLVANLTAKRSGAPSANGTHIYIDSEYGKVEIGSAYSSSSQMNLSGGGNSKATVDGWTGNIFVGDEEMYPVIKSHQMMIDESTKPSTVEPEASRKISYFTPDIHGLKLGISYVPDTANLGGGSRMAKGHIVKRKNPKTGLNYYSSVYAATDAFTMGMSVDYDINDDIHLKTAVTGQVGKAVQKVSLDNGATFQNNTKKVRDLQFFNVGGQLSYGSMKYNISYTSLGKSLIWSGDEFAKNDSYYTSSGISYSQGAIGASITYFHSKNAYNNTFDSVTLGTEYKIDEGLIPYAEIAYFKCDSDRKRSGVSGFLGVKFKF